MVWNRDKMIICTARPPADPPPAEDVNATCFSYLEVAGDACLEELDDGRWSSKGETGTHVRMECGVWETGSKCHGRTATDMGEGARK